MNPSPGDRLGECRLAAILWLSCSVATAALAGSPSDSATVLDPVFVEASTGNPWQLISVPGFEILSRCPPSFNVAYAAALKNAAEARLAFLPANFWGDLPAPIEVILYNREPEKESGPFQGKPIDLTWASEDGAILGSDTVEQAHPIVAGDGDTFVDCGNYWDVMRSGGAFSVDVDSAIRLSNRLPRLAGWFITGVEGPEGVYVNRVIKDTSEGPAMIITNALWTSSAETLGLQDERKKASKDGGRVRPRALMPLAELFAGKDAGGSGSLWTAQAALFVRWGLFKAPDRAAFLNFVDQSSRQPVTEELFKKCLGMSFNEAQERMADYLPFAASEAITVRLGSQGEDLPEMRGASSSEVARILGDWGRLEGRATGPEISEFQEECLRQADKQFEKGILSRARDPQFLAAYGLYALQAGESGRAQQALEEATSKGVIRPRAYVELARMRLENALPTIASGVGDLNQRDFSDIKALLTTARVQMPSLVATYTLLARVLQHAPEAPKDEDLYILRHALESFPGDATLAYKVATLYRRLGRLDEAADIIRKTRPFAGTDHDRKLLASFPIRN